ncbi:hypothetical protein ACSDQ9_00365 [Aestuariimicrobium soli]|uniref:hypothetical protein n=1 Tax=Aestuariimicrobium soli TaxID=2035834 RepID=UPI003EB916C7
MVAWHRPLTAEQFAGFVATHRSSVTAAAASLLGTDENDRAASAAADRAFAEVWARRWAVWRDPVHTLRTALVRRTRPARLAEPPLHDPPNVLALRARAESARGLSSSAAAVNRRALVVGGVGAATAAGAATLAVAVGRSVHTTSTTIVGGSRVNLTVELVGRGQRRSARVYTSDPQWAATLPALVGSFMVDSAHATSVLLPSPGLAADATLQTLVLHQPGLVFADVVDTTVVPLATSRDEPMAAGLFALSAYGASGLVWGDATGRVIGDRAVVQAPFPGDSSRVCYVANGHLVVRHLARGLSQPRLVSRALWVDLPSVSGAPAVSALAVSLPDSTGLVVAMTDEAGDLSWDLPSLAASSSAVGTARFWHVAQLPQSRGRETAEQRITLRTATDVVQYRVNF